MKLRVCIDYMTRWGEQIVLSAGENRYPLECIDGSRWMAEINDFDMSHYRYHCYELVRDGAVIRKEFMAHVIPAQHNVKVLAIHDMWLDRPDEAPLYSDAFTKGIFRRKQSKPVSSRGSNLEFLIRMPGLRPNEILALAGSGDELGNWKVFHRFDDSDFPNLSLKLHVSGQFSYKFLVMDNTTGEVVAWEDTQDRFMTEVPAKGEKFIISDVSPVFGGRRYRGAGTAVPVFSLRSESGFGTGEFLDLKKLVDWAVLTGQRLIQLLPVNDTTMTGKWTDSYPYNANSTFALHPQYINLVAAGVKEDAAYKALKDELNSSAQIDYERVNALKTGMLRRLYDRVGEKTAARKDYVRFMQDNGHWLLPYAAFCVMRDVKGTADFTRWGRASRYSERILSSIRSKYEKEVGFYCFVQYHLDRQLSEVCEYAHSHGVILKGDLPIGISRTSVDAWLYPELFHMDSQAGAPPDAFSALGQNWGFPTYNWQKMAEDGYAWWKSRMTQMQKYFDAFRIDHILGFFRIWEIPVDAVHGLLGHFNPALPYTAEELAWKGFDMRDGRYSTPYVCDYVIGDIFGDLADEVRARYIVDGHMAPEYSSQRKIVENIKPDDGKSSRILEGMLRLSDDVLFVEDPRRKGCYHPRIAAHSTYTYRALSDMQKHVFDELYDDFFYRRHNAFWKDCALAKLPALIDSTGMLACGEDLGMIPASVPEVMSMLRILSLEIQRMPKSPDEEFADPAVYPYHSVCTTSTHDMNPVRAWWEEDRGATQRFYNTVLKEPGEAPVYCEPWICERILKQHLASPSMFTVLPIQDWLSIDGDIRLENPHMERINVPANSRHYWRYRLHMTLEDLIADEAFTAKVRSMISGSGRN